MSSPKTKSKAQDQQLLKQIISAEDAREEEDNVGVYGLEEGTPSGRSNRAGNIVLPGSEDLSAKKRHISSQTSKKQPVTDNSPWSREQHEVLAAISANHTTRLTAGLSNDPYYDYTYKSSRSTGSSRRKALKDIDFAAFSPEYQPEKPLSASDSKEDGDRNSLQLPMYDSSRDSIVSESYNSSWAIIIRSIATLGVIYGDIGTSVLYTFTAIFSSEVSETEGVDGEASKVAVHLTEEAIVGALSNVLWTLILVVCVKYCGLVLRADYHMEGGTFALYQRVMSHKERIPMWSQTVLLILTCAGASLLLGESAITPAISILSALEGIELVTEDFTTNYVVICGVLILVVLFAIQFKGTDKVGRTFGPAMMIWFLSIGILGIYNLVTHDGAKVVKAFNPATAIKWWIDGPYSGRKAWETMASVVLTVTGTEALFADMGHFGRGPVYISWFCLVFPMLILQYLGQCAFLISFINDASVSDERKYFVITKSVFWGAIPGGSNPDEGKSAVYFIMLAVATFATIVASQALITGAFTLMSQASTLEILPRLNIVHTSKNQKGQVYIGAVNVVLAVLCISLVISFRTSAKLAAAYGCAVTSVFFITSTIMCWFVAPVCWRWPWFVCALLYCFLATMDGIFATANYLKVPDGGWFPLVLAFVILSTMGTWKSGKIMSKLAYAREKETAESLPLVAYKSSEDQEASGQTVVKRARSRFDVYNLAEVQEGLRAGTISPAQGGIGIFMTPTVDEMPVSMARLISGLGVTPKYTILLTVKISNAPFVASHLRTEFLTLNSSVNMYSVIVHYGWAEPLSELSIMEYLQASATPYREGGLVMPVDLQERLNAIESVKQGTAVRLQGFDEPICIFVNNNHLYAASTEKNFIIRATIAWFDVLKRMFNTSATEHFHLPPANTTEVGTVLLFSSSGSSNNQN